MAVFQVETLVDLLDRLLHGVADFGQLDLGDDIETIVGHIAPGRRWCPCTLLVYQVKLGRVCQVCFRSIDTFRKQELESFYTYVRIETAVRSDERWPKPNATWGYCRA